MITVTSLHLSRIQKEINIEIFRRVEECVSFCDDVEIASVRPGAGVQFVLCQRVRVLSGMRLTLAALASPQGPVPGPPVKSEHHTVASVKSEHHTAAEESEEFVSSTFNDVKNCNYVYDSL